MANPRKPANLKAIAGTKQPCREAPPAIDLPLIVECPPAPDWLPNAAAVREWDRLAQILTANKLLTEAGLGVLGMLCALHGKIVQLYAAGESPSGHMVAQYRSLANDFGLTPVAQGKVKPSSGKDATENPFAKNGKRAS